jgi:hypothetical protein
MLKNYSLTCICIAIILAGVTNICFAQNTEISASIGLAGFSEFSFLQPDWNLEGNFIRAINRSGYFDFQFGRSHNDAPFGYDGLRSHNLISRNVVYVTAAYGSYLKTSESGKFYFSYKGGISFRKANDVVLDSVSRNTGEEDLYSHFDVHYNPGIMAGIDMEWILCKPIGLHLDPEFYFFTKDGITLMLNVGIAYRFGKSD